MSNSQPTESFGGESKGRSPWLIVGVVVGLILCLVVVWGVMGQRGGGATPEPPVLPTLVAESSDAVCDRIDASGTIVAGTAGDYPPFEFYNDQFQLDGFDVALMRAVGQNLGVAVDFKDYAFDGLGGALQLGEIDAAIAAITVTNEREGQLDFSTGYYYGRGVAVARAGANLIGQPSDFAGRRVGVERGTIYQSWAEANLVAAGIVPPQELFAYAKAADAVRDLVQERLDVVLLDEGAAQSVTADGALAVVGEGAVAQVYAIGLPQGAACIQRRINQALADLTAAGTIDDLARQYIGLVSVPIPVPTPAPAEPTPTAAPAACIDSSAYVMDLTYDDEGGTDPPEVGPGEEFTKGWRIRNSGTCPWTDAYRLNYVGGNNPAAQMDGESVNIVGGVPPGSTYDFYVDLTAPSGVSGVLQGRWQMQNPADVFFGQTVYVMVEVVETPPEPEATATSVPPSSATIPPPLTATVPPQATSTPQPTAPPTPSDPLFGQTFGFYAIQGQATIPDVPLTVTFGNLGGTGGLSGFDGCNTFGGTYNLTPSSESQGGLTISIGAGTAVACEQAVADQAQAFRAALALTTAYVYPPRSLLLSLLDQTGTELLNGQLQ